MTLLPRIANRLRATVSIPAERQSGHDLSVRVDHQRLRVRCERHELVLTPEALGTVFSIPAWSQHRSLRYQELDTTWAENHRQAMALIHAWWGYDTGPLQVGKLQAQPHSGIGRTGLAFSLGVDSMYSCFFAETRPDLLVLVGGFDVPWGAGQIFNKMAASTQEIADALGIDWTLVETDLRKHYLFRRGAWERTHGAAVAFVGMLLSKHIDTMLISSTLSQSDLMPYGSHPDLDTLWSSSRLQMRHEGQKLTRLQKIEKLISHPESRQIFQKHVRVCWENPGVDGNCGECAKCLMLRLSLMKLGARFLPETLPATKPVDSLLARLKPTQNIASLIYQRELLDMDDREADAALRDYIERSERAIAALHNT